MKVGEYFNVNYYNFLMDMKDKLNKIKIYIFKTGLFEILFSNFYQ